MGEVDQGELFGELRALVHESARPRHMRCGELDRVLGAIAEAQGQAARHDALCYLMDVWQLDDAGLDTLRFAHACSVALELDVLADTTTPHAMAVYDSMGDLSLETMRQWIVDDLGPSAWEDAQRHLRWRDGREERTDEQALMTRLLDDEPTLAEQAALDEWSEGELREELGISPCFMVAEAPSLMALLQGLRAAGFYFWHPASLEQAALDDLGHERHLSSASRFLEIADPAMRRLALALWGGLELMGMSDSAEESYYCAGVEQVYPAWRVVRCWDAIPHRQEEGYCIMRRAHHTAQL